jgi:hypothetical protein
MLFPRGKKKDTFFFARRPTPVVWLAKGNSPTTMAVRQAEPAGQLGFEQQMTDSETEEGRPRASSGRLSMHYMGHGFRDWFHDGSTSQRGEGENTLSLALGLTLVQGGYVFFFVVAFSAMPVGYGLSVFRELIENHTLMYACAALGLLVFFLAYIADISYWSEHMAPLKTLVFASIALSLTVTSIFGAKSYPIAPLALMIALQPLVLIVIKRFALPDISPTKYLRSCAASLFIIFVAVEVLWILWAFGDEKNEWGRELERTYAGKLGCHYTTGSCSSNCASGLEEDKFCLIPYIVWIAPTFAGSVCFAFAFICLLLADGKEKRHMGVHIFITLVIVGLGGMWVAASVSSMEAEFSNIMTTLMIMFLSIWGSLIGCTVGWQTLRAKAGEVPFIQQLEKICHSDWIKALGFFCCSPLFVMYTALSFVNQIVRLNCCRCKCFYNQKMHHLTEHREAEGWLTKACSDQISQIWQWNWSSVWVKIMYIGLGYITLEVGVMKCITVFLAWLNATLASMPLGQVVAIFYFTGLFLFLLPPVPGVPVYLAGGVIMVKATLRTCRASTTCPGEMLVSNVTDILAAVGDVGDGALADVVGATAECPQGMTGSMSFPASVLFMIGIGFCIKMNAIAIQQKGFGEQLSNNLTVKCLVGVNSNTVKAMRLILTEKGMTLGKVCILCGGPDWPTSVLTGILKLDLLPMLFGSIPIIFIAVGPCVLAGAFTMKAGLASSGGNGAEDADPFW